MRYTSSRQKVFLIGLIVFSVFFQPTFPFHWAGTRLYDLETVTAAEFTTEATFWTGSYLITANVLTYKCGNDYIMGGYNVLAGSGTTGSTAYYGQYFSRVYSTLPTHNQINLSVKIVPVDSWDGLTVDDHFSIAIDGVEIYAWRIYAYSGTYATTNICGNPGYTEYPAFMAYLTYPHSSITSLTLKFISYLNENSGNESLGFRDIIIDFVTVASPSSSICGVNTVPLTDKPCSCPDSHQYPNPALSGTCSGCDVTCNTCTAGTATSCTSCYPGRYWTGTQCIACTSPCSTCTGSGTSQCITCISGYFLVGSTCYPTCNDPLISTTSGGVVSCSTPCTTSPSTIVMWDGTCSSSCAYPRVPATWNTFSVCTFPCSSGQVVYWNGTCKDTCPFPLKSIVQNSRTFCQYPCATTQWLYFNGSCLNSCGNPLYSMVEGSPARQFCYYLCQPDQWLYWDTTCHSDCPFPLSKRVEGSPLRNYCDYPCQPVDFLFWNGSCLASCPIALTTRIEGTPLRKYCDFPCASSKFSYWNGSCFDTCDFPLSTRIEGSPMVRGFCDFPCQPSEYLYKNAFCYGTCDSPYLKAIYGTPSRMFCNYPCRSDQYWSYFGDCWNTCPFPYTKGTWNDDKFCNNPCPSSSKPYFSQEFNQCVKSCELPSIVDWTRPYLSCTPYHVGSLLDAPMEPKAVTLVSLIKPMQYVRYMDISMPFRLKRIGLSQARSVMTIRTGIDIWNGARTAYSEAGIYAPEIFEEHGLSPSFLANFWQDMTLIWMGMVAGFVFAFLERSGFRYGFEYLGAIFGRLAKIFAINFLLMVVAYDIDDIILFAGIQFQTIKTGVSPWYTAFSIILCLVCIGAAIFLIGGIFYIVRKRIRGELQVVPANIDGVVITFEKKYQWCQIFWTGFNTEDNKYNQYFYLIYVLRIAFPMLMVSILYKHPLAIVIIELVVNIMMIGLIIYMKPFEKKINYIQLLIYETTIFIMNVCMLVLTIRDHLGRENLYQSSVVTGDIIILGNVFVNFMTIVFTIIKLYLEGLEIFYVWRDNSKVEMKFKIAMWLQLLAVPLQQCNFWFEELIPSGVPTYPYSRGFIIDIETEARLKAGRETDRGVMRTNEDELMTTQRPFVRGNESQMTMRHETSNLNLDTSPEIEVPRKERKRRGRPKVVENEREPEEVFFVNREGSQPVPVVNNNVQNNNLRNNNYQNYQSQPQPQPRPQTNSVLDVSNIEMSAAVRRNIEVGIIEKKIYNDGDSLFDE